MPHDQTYDPIEPRRDRRHGENWPKPSPEEDLPPDEEGTVAEGEGVAGHSPEPQTDPPKPGKDRATGELPKWFDEYAGRIKEQPPGRLWFPHLLIRSHPGDTGQRPVWPSTPSWLSPDIHLFPWAGGGMPSVDLSRGVLSPQVGETYCVGVHVWNLGRFPAHGVMVKAWWVEPGFFSGIPDPRYTPQFIGGVWTDLGDKDSDHAHGIVRIPTPWTIRDTGMLHQCLLATVECVSDPWTGVLDANHDRHVGQRNLTLVEADTDLAPLLEGFAHRLDVRDALTVAFARTETGQLRGAAGRGMATSAKEGPGWPVASSAAQPLARLLVGDGSIRVTSTRRKGPTREVERLDEAVALALGADGVSGKALAHGEVLRGRGDAMVHLATKTGGYSLLFP